MTMNTRQGSARLFYMDNLRAIAMLAGIFFHAALAYSPMSHSIWPTADQHSHWLFDVFAWGSHLFRMPVFFVMAGFFCALVLQQRGGKAFFKNRLLRIALPIVIFLPLLSIAMMFVIQYGLEQVQNKSPFLAYIQMLMALPEPPVAPLSTLHLWFLYHLLFLYLLTYIAHVLLSAKITNWFTSLKPGNLMLLLISASVPALYVVSVPFPAPEWVFPALWAIWFYGLFFALGYGFFAQPLLIEQFTTKLPVYLASGLASFALYYYLLPASLMPDNQPQGLLKLAITVLEATSAVLLTLSAVLYAKRYLNSNSVLIRYISKVSYWVYIVHLPVLFFIQLLLMDRDWHISVKFLVSSVGTLTISIVSFHLIVSWTWLSRMLVSKSSK
jgi:glucans biosynthesis protein C